MAGLGLAAMMNWVVGEVGRHVELSGRVGCNFASSFAPDRNVEFSFRVEDNVEGFWGK